MCPQQQQQRNIEIKRLEKLTKHRQLPFELRERRPGYEIKVVPLVIGALGGGMMKNRIRDMGMIFDNNEVIKRTVAEDRFDGQLDHIT